MSAAPNRFQGLRPGTEFGPYTVVRCIGVGGMGSVFEADHRLLQRKVALKVLHAHDTPGVNVRERFMREGSTLVRLSHPNIVTVYDAGELDGLPYLAMELLVGETLERLLSRTGPLDPARVVRMLAPVADGLELAHGKGIVHRDVKPENLFVTRDERGRDCVKLVDFGIAKDLRISSQHNTIIGTPSYMAPEQLLGAKSIDGRCDQFSLAVVAYEALTGRKPFEADTVLELAEQLDRGAFLPPSAHGVVVPPGLETALVRALQTPVEARFGSAGEFAFALLGSITDRTLWGPAPPSAASMVTSGVVPLDRARASAPAAMRTTQPTRPSRSPVALASVASALLLGAALVLRAYVARHDEAPTQMPARLVESEGVPTVTAAATPAAPAAPAAMPTSPTPRSGPTDVTQPAPTLGPSPRRAAARSPAGPTGPAEGAPTLRLER